MHIDQGHRKRLRDRMLAEGLDSFDEVHVLELILFYAIAQKDTKPLARQLLDHFGSLNGVLEAPAHELMQVEGVGEVVAAYLTMFGALERYRKVRRDVRFTPMDSVEKYGTFLASHFSGRRDETVFLLCLDAKCKMLNCRMVGEGDVNSANVPIRRMVEIALASNASSVILAHNHPSGVAVPSGEDIMTTKVLAQALRAIDIVLIDHIVVADDEYVSMAQSGLYSPAHFS